MKRFGTLALFVGFCLFNTTILHAAQPLKIMTLNLANYNDHIYWSQRIKLIVDVIEKSHADIVALQETRFDPDHESTAKSYQDMAQQIMYELNLRGDFLQGQLVSQPVMYYPHAMNDQLGSHYYPLPAAIAPDQQNYYWEGLSIISKLPILETGNVFLTQAPNCDNDNRRVTQYIKVKNESETYYIVNVHFSGEACLRTNVSETLAYLKPYINQQNMLILGDFNALPTNPELQQLNDLGMTDIWSKLHPAENGYTSPAENPQNRIDYIWVNKKLAKSFTDANQIQIIANQAQDGLFPSDHFGLVVTLKSKRK